MSDNQSSGSSPQATALHIVVVGASSGGVDALIGLAQALPAGFEAAIFVVLHIAPHTKSVLPELLSRAGPLPAAHAVDGEAIHPGRFYIAPPDHHLLVETGYLRLSTGPRENHVRPAVDTLFRSAALAYGPNVIGVVLSGELSDGTAGLWDIKQQGGIAVVQDPGDAAYPSMPHSALDQVPVDYLLPLADIPGLLVQLTEVPVPEALKEGVQTKAMSLGEGGSADRAPGSTEVARDMAHQVAGERDGLVTVYVCPDCGGTLWQANAGNLTRFRCHVGHVYSGDNLLKGYTEDIEHSLWHVVRTLYDRVNLARQFALNARASGKIEEATHYEQKARRDEEHAASIRQMIGAAL